MDNGCSLQEAVARATLHEVHGKGHAYVEIRKDGRRPIFFCVLCLSRCYSDSALFDHLHGSFHSQRYAAAQLTLLGRNPWPFSDGVFFFHKTCDTETSQLQNLQRSGNGFVDLNCGKGEFSRENENYSEGNSFANVPETANSTPNSIVLPGVLLDDRISNLKAEHVGIGKIGFRINVMNSCINKIWCAWLGRELDAERETSFLPVSDFGLVVFSYHYDLGRKPVANDLSVLGSSDLSYEDADIQGRENNKSFSKPENEALGNNSSSPEAGLGLSAERELSPEDDTCNINESQHFHSHLHKSKFISNRIIRKTLRRQQRLAAERMCDLCQTTMLPGKDVAALFNRTTGNIVCRSRNMTGAFHAFHASCLIRWILFCEYKIWNDSHASQKMNDENTGFNAKRKRPRNSKIHNNEHVKKADIVSALCPECQGTGVNIEGEELEKPTIPLSKMYLYKLKANEAQEEWMRSPEILDNCSTGLSFSLEENWQDEVHDVKFIQFYRAKYAGGQQTQFCC